MKGLKLRETTEIELVVRVRNSDEHVRAPEPEPFLANATGAEYLERLSFTLSVNAKAMSN
jgi:hypothetical protein